MDEKLISVIVPIYNVEKYLEKCIDSIINQTYKNLEIILIDDGSTDKSGNICDKYKKYDSRIVVIHENNCGLSYARNKGLDLAKGQLISFVDSDDSLELNMLEVLMNNMYKYDSDISICNYFYIKDNDKKICVNNSNLKDFSSFGREKFDNIYNEYKSLAVVVWNKLYKREIFDEIRFPNGKIYEDAFVICDILDNSKRVSYTLKPLYNYVYRANSIINTFAVNHFNRIDAFNKRISFYAKNGYDDLVYDEKNRKTDVLINYLIKMKNNNIKDKETYNKYYKELVETNKEVKWKGSTKYVKFYKVLRRPSISILAFGLRVRDLIRR